MKKRFEMSRNILVGRFEEERVKSKGGIDNGWNCRGGIDGGW